MEYTFNEDRITKTFNIMNTFNVVNLVWKGDNIVKGLCKASKTGHGSNLFDKLSPISHTDFYNKLVKYANDNKYKLKIYDRGMTFDELLCLANEFKRNVEQLDKELVFSVDAYVDYIMYVNVIQTFDGHINEVMLSEYIQNNWYKDAHRVTGELDSRYGVDILYRGDTRGIQIKSINFFLGNKESVIHDRLNIKTLKDEVKTKFNIDMKYAIFDRKSQKYLKSTNGTPIFSYEEFNTLLFSKDKPHPIFRYSQMSV